MKTYLKIFCIIFFIFFYSVNSNAQTEQYDVTVRITEVDFNNILAALIEARGLNWGEYVDGFVTLKVYDILGREVATLVNEEKQEGRYSVNFDATHLSNGVYFYSMKSGDPTTSSGQSYFSVKKMILLK